MTIAVLVKVVPELDKLTFYPTTRTVRRADAPLYMNPFDQRSLLVALTLRESADEEVVVVSMGPPDARPPLLEALALGADRVLLVSDRALTGSDTLVTARVLAAALRPIGARLVLAGQWTTDSSTGQMPAQLAGLLDLPMVEAARRITRSPDGALTIAGETNTGYAEYVVSPPCLVTVGEKVIKSRKPTPEALKGAEAKPLQMLGATDLGLAPEQLGLGGSPTQVLGLENEEPARSPRIFTEGSPDERARQATQEVLRLLGQPRPLPPALRPAPEVTADEGEVLVVVSSGDLDIETEALPLLSEVRRLGAPLWPSAVGFCPLSERAKTALAESGALRLYWREDAPKDLGPEGAAVLLAELLWSRPRAAGALFLCSPWAREVAGRLSSRAGLGLTGDAVGLQTHPDLGLVFRKPSFGGGLLALVASKHRPALATVRPGALAPGKVPDPRSSMEILPIPGTFRSSRVRRTATVRERDERYGALEHARVVVAVGNGVGGVEGVLEVLNLVQPLRPALGASRKAVDAGWVPVQLQVGLTGRSLAPDLYIGAGVSGKVNHLIGVKRARVLVGINPLATEPLFQRVDVGLVGTWQELLPPLVQELARRLPGELLSPN